MQGTHCAFLRRGRAVTLWQRDFMPKCDSQSTSLQQSISAGCCPRQQRYKLLFWREAFSFYTLSHVWENWGIFQRAKYSEKSSQKWQDSLFRQGWALYKVCPARLCLSQLSACPLPGACWPCCLHLLKGHVAPMRWVWGVPPWGRSGQGAQLTGQTGNAREAEQRCGQTQG